jgi:membrane-bound lytic murein transglycosylase MltF
MKKLILKTQLAVLCCFLFTISCKQSTAPVTSKPPDPQVSPAAQAAQTPEAIDPTLLERLKNERWTGDIDKLRERRYIRALVLYNKTNFFYDGPQPRGITYEALKEFEKFLNTRLNSGDKPLHLVFIPVSREEGIKRMKDGRGDIAASNVPIMPELQKVVDFSDPIREGAKEVIVTGPSDPAINTLDDLAGKEIFIRKVSRYWPNLERLNERFRAQGS